MKFFSVVSVMFLPATLIASMYGMNFEMMPELKFKYGYPMAMGMMMLPPVMISLPFKLLIFVLVDGWNLLIGNLVKSFH